MPKLTVLDENILREIPFSPGTSLREILDAAGLRVRTGCRGNGACGLCLVRIEAGNTNYPTKNEHLLLTREQLKGNTRLACQLMPENDLCVRIINTVWKSNWRDLTSSHLLSTPSHLPPLAAMQSPQSQYGLAVDLGTTHISLSLWDLKHGHRLASRTGVNQQCHYGTDVVTRLIVAGESPGNAQRLSRMALDAVCEGLLDVCSRNGFDLREVTHVTIVGNSPMLMLLTEAYPRILLQPQFWTSPIECKPDNPQTWVDVLGIHPGATVEVIPPLAGFVGSDLLAGVLATRLTDHRSGLLIDFGTNSEMALWDGHTLWVTSAAGGPAFEGCGMQCGLPAETGAIYHVDRKEDSTELHLEVIGGGEARGLCGSGLVDLIACLRNTGDLTAIGKLAIPYRKDGFVVQEKGLPIRLTGKDVDVFQRGKAAIGAGIKTLLSKAQMRLEKLSRICVCGAFGQHLNARNARLIGLLPDTPPEKVELCGNTALAGCERLLLSPTKESDLASLRKRAAIINLSQSPDFETLFLESLYLQPLSTQPFAAGLTEMTTELRTKYA